MRIHLWFKLLDKICLTYSQGSEGRSCSRKRTSAKAGCASSLTLSVQAKIRSPFDQDMLIFSGTSYFTVEQSHMFNSHLYIFTQLFSVRNGANMSGAPVCASITDVLFDWQLEVPTWASTQISAGLYMSSSSSLNVCRESLMPTTLVFLVWW